MTEYAVLKEPQENERKEIKMLFETLVGPGSLKFAYSEGYIY